MAPAFIANRPFISTAELGNIFDPAQWTMIENTSGTASAGSGGGFSLAIGRPEFAKFDREGQRAAQLGQRQNRGGELGRRFFSSGVPLKPAAPPQA